MHSEIEFEYSTRSGPRVCLFVCCLFSIVFVFCFLFCVVVSFCYFVCFVCVVVVFYFLGGFPCFVNSCCFVFWVF